MNLSDNQKKKQKTKLTGYNQKCKILSSEGTKTIYIRTGEDDEGNLREVRVDIDKEGTFLNGILDCFCILLNITLQHSDISLEKIGKQFIFTNFPPNGFVKNHVHIKNCTSILDLLFRDLLINYCNREDLKHNDS